MFIKSSVERVNYRGDFIYNHPVNLLLCKGIIKNRIKFYPDNTGIPSIYFKGCDIEWGYLSIEQRDKDFEDIANNVKIVEEAICQLQKSQR